MKEDIAWTEQELEHKFWLILAKDFETVRPKPAHIMNSIQTTETTSEIITINYHKQEINIPKFLGNKSYC